MPLADALESCTAAVLRLAREIDGGPHVVVLAPVAGETARRREKLCGRFTTRTKALVVLRRQQSGEPFMAAHLKGHWHHVIRPA